MIAIVGRIPLPYGGVSVHLQRLLGRLRSESIQYDFYDLGGKCDLKFRVLPGSDRLVWLLYFLWRARRRYGLIHFHASNPYVLILADLLMAGSGVRLAYSLHGEGLYRWASKTGPVLLRWALRKALRRADHLFSINPIVAEKLPDLGVDPNRVTWMAAYLPPTAEEMDPSHLSPHVCDFLVAHSPVIGMQAWFGSFQDGQDIYGLLQIVPLLQRLHVKFPKLGLCTVISGTHCPNHRKQIFAAREGAGLAEDWLLLEEGVPAVSLFRKCDLFLRPTITDGDSLSIRECLSFGVPVVASDAVARPEGCTLYMANNIDAMVKAVALILGDNLSGANEQHISKDQDHALCVIDYYRHVLNNLCTD